ncbi:coiled-coil domain-containing protein [Paenibacillus sp. y28]|uniref:coiled-coil domain-containing protein n=1 Tax=Paenibacillus sp. y28 TaxID=3129110 RepID=UPI0030194800
MAYDTVPRKPARRGIMALLVLLVPIWLISPLIPASTGVAAAAPLQENAAAPDQTADTELHSLLQKGITLSEVNQELARLAVQEQELQELLLETEEQLQEASAQLVQARRQANHMLAAYYMGSRKSVWLLLLQARSFSEAILISELAARMMEHDRRILTRLTDAQQNLQSLREGRIRAQDELLAMKTRLSDQKAKLEALEQEVEQQITSLPEDRQALARAELAAMSQRWEQQGKPLFNRYFKALSDASQSLTDLLSQGNNMSLQGGMGLKASVQLTDTQINEHLRSRNELFRNMSIRFGRNEMVVSGEEDGQAMMIKGTYQIENTPQNAIRFKIDDLQYNGFATPESTKAELETEYPLVIYPQLFASFIQATDIQLTEGKLQILLQFKL